MISITVVIPLYNKAARINRCLSSIANQTYKPSRVIIVDDGSTDNPKIQEILFQKLNINFIQQKNKGVSNARNVAISLVKTNYVALIDADDEWMPSHLINFVEGIRRNNDCAIYTSMHYTIYNHINNKKRIRNSFLKYREGVKKYFIIQYSLNYDLINSSSVCINLNKFKSRSLFNEDLKRCEDIVFWLKTASRSSVYLLPFRTAIINKDILSSTSLRDTNNNYFLLNALKKESLLRPKYPSIIIFLILNYLRHLYNKLGFKKIN